MTEIMEYERITQVIKDIKKKISFAIFVTLRIIKQFSILSINLRNCMRAHVLVHTHTDIYVCACFLGLYNFANYLCKFLKFVKVQTALLTILTHFWKIIL